MFMKRQKATLLESKTNGRQRILQNDEGAILSSFCGKKE